MEWCPECNGEMNRAGGTRWECPECDEYFFVCPDCGNTVLLDYWNEEQNVCCECEDNDEDGIVVFVLEEDNLIDKLFELYDERCDE